MGTAEKRIIIEPVTRIGDKGIQYLGRLQRCFSVEVAPGRMATVMDYDVEEFLGSCVEDTASLPMTNSRGGIMRRLSFLMIMPYLLRALRGQVRSRNVLGATTPTLRRHS